MLESYLDKYMTQSSMFMTFLVFCPRKQSAILYHVFIWQMTALLDVGFEGLIVLTPLGVILLDISSIR